ncbi:MAG: GTP 3',8-cyclase MoaA [Gemmataceae bacterium]|nr:GTP 3',8-cyclase MoaA [Gemmataceae bacterium]
MSKTGLLQDSFGRTHNNLRISVTDRCNLRCEYCMPEEVEFLDHRELLTFEEISEVAQVAVGLGINKIRLTGGEPLLRRDLPVLVKFLTGIPQITDLSLTTNGLLLKNQVKKLKEAGLRRLTISLDTLDPGRFRQLCKRDGLDQVLQGIEAALQEGFEKIKLNTVCIKGINDQDIVPLAEYARSRKIELRFIEYMPIGANPWERNKVLFAHEILEILETQVAKLFPGAAYDPTAPAMEFTYQDGQGSIGIIASISRPFCQHCNRVRLTAEGKFRNCLFALEEVDLKPLIRPDFQPEEIRKAMISSVEGKWEGHEINTARFIKPGRTMHTIGG